MKFKINDVLLIANYYDELSTMIIRKIIIDKNGITYSGAVGFANEDNYINVSLRGEYNFGDKGEPMYRIVKKVGNIDEGEYEQD